MGKQSTLLVVVMFSTAAGIVSAACPAGMKNKANVGTTKCIPGSTGDCQTHCCVNDPLMCLNQGSICGSTKYKDSTKAGNLIGTDAVAACCTDKTTCAAGTCLAGTTKKSSPPTLCASDAGSCHNIDSAGCCQANTDICYVAYQGNSNLCGGDKYFPSGTAAATVTGSTAAACCTAMSTCGANTCRSGLSAKAGVSSTKCAPVSAQDKSSSTYRCEYGSNCCENDATKCATAPGVSCDATHFKDSAKQGNTAGATAAEKKANCCTEKSTCAVYWVDSASGAQALMPAVATTLALAAVILG